MSILPLSSTLGLFGTSALRPVSTNFAATAGSLSLFSGSSTIVDLSSFGQLLSAVATFGNRLAVLRPGSSDSGIGQNFGTDFGSLAAEAQFFVDSFNSLQSSLGEVNVLFGTAPASSPAAQLSADLRARVEEAFDNGDSALTQLSDLGIELQPSLLPGTGGRLGIDMAALRAAFEADPEGSFSLLARAAEAFATVATEFTSSNGDVNSLLATQLRFSSLQLTLGLFDSGSDSSQGGLQNLTDLLMLASLGNGGPESQTRVVAALNEFSLISALLR
ncbi:hypothetical protein U5817_06430 [Aromatoleum evansii]|uniref:Flagellar hook-associated protein 2 C-terminal domain-containing protein n=1 Tax=Aromatoleum evansii TaxID=59406 RepID=A0ABZ1APG9_AROEV|nr:hypothetical protein U5817_06430 [Aromatoleum evansii]